MARLLVIDDETLIRMLTREAGEALGYEVLSAASLHEGRSLLDAETAAGRSLDLIVLDVMLPDGDGLAELERLTSGPGRPDVIVITGHGNAAAAEAALSAGAWDYLVKPLRLRELTRILGEVIQWRQTRRAVQDGKFQRPNIIGSSSALTDALRELQEAASSNVNVLITGETGSGKDLFANALHLNSSRSAGPFITVDCTSMPDNLVEAHLFGHARGAFTGADRAREGLLAAADQGTLFLDEVGELPLPAQGSFLRALEQHRFRPVGEIREISSDFRLVAATNRNLDDMVDMDLFRSDLRFRLRGMHIHVPPLRRRLEDIPALAARFIESCCQHNGFPCKEAGQDVLDMLTTYPWPGNVRELKHAMERACAASGNGRILARHLPMEIRISLAKSRLSFPGAALGGDPPSLEAFSGIAVQATLKAAPETAEKFPTLKENRARADTEYLAALLARFHGDVRRAAPVAGLSRGHLYELLKKYGMTKDGVDAPDSPLRSAAPE